ncbi:NAC domain containing protein 96 [Striga hermonthica]|uniref:NAC domain containing protein 96 n=1 Tax=Striga hermonthica TaxID=68872 RepID=A0A9N7N7F3_STRHE|nr:NAC domain containing protein 96 [Striga hermonthica]
MDPGRVSSTDLTTGELPFGYRFHPTPFEVVQYYLWPKLKGEGLPSGYIKDLDVYKLDPRDIPINVSKYARDNEAYFFVPITRELAQAVHNSTRTTPTGYWKMFEWNSPLYGPDGSIIGHKNKLKFYKGKYPNGVITDWKMVEYRTCFRANDNVESLMVCKIKLKGEEEVIIEEEISSSSGEEDGGNS